MAKKEHEWLSREMGDLVRRSLVVKQGDGWLSGEMGGG